MTRPIITFDEVTKKLSCRQKHLLLGNGFSIAYDYKIFSYNALSTFIDQLEDDLLDKLFRIINTKNFELIMQQLDTFIELARGFSEDKTLESKLEAASESLKTSLIAAVKDLHPNHVFQVPEDKSIACSKFLNQFIVSKGNIFSTNYDLLLYWVLMRNSTLRDKAIDGFGREIENYTGEYIPGEDIVWSDLQWGDNKCDQNIHYLHGALHLFDTGTVIKKEEYEDGNYLLNQIESKMKKKDYPIFVTAGDGNEKLKHIMHNQYLSFCYEKLCKIEGALVTFGFQFGEYDDHIIDAINIAAKHGRKVTDKLWSVYIGVYSNEDIDHIERIRHKFKCKINLFDAKTANIWG